MSTADGRRPPPRRVWVVGTCGSGKTTLAARLARLLDVVHVELDALHWEPDWTEATPEAFAARLRRALGAPGRATDGRLGDPGWVADGNYAEARALALERADAVVWLDLPLRVVLWRLVRRSWRRSVRREVLWAGNRETLRRAFFGPDSVIWWAIRTHARRRREYGALFASPPREGVEWVRLRSAREAEEYLRDVYLRTRPDWPVIGRVGPARPRAVEASDGPARHDRR